MQFYRPIPFCVFLPSSPLRLPCWLCGGPSCLLDNGLGVGRDGRGAWFDRRVGYKRPDGRNGANNYCVDFMLTAIASGTGGPCLNLDLR